MKDLQIHIGQFLICYGTFIVEELRISTYLFQMSLSECILENSIDKRENDKTI